MVKKFHLLIFFLAILGLIMRLWNINFGLPHSHYADEPEIGELAIKYTYEFRTMLKNNDVYKMIPENYVYGTLPVYFYTLAVMLFSKSLNIFQTTFSKADLYTYMRVINAIISFMTIPTFYWMVKHIKLTNRRLTEISAIFLTAFNWKFIIHAHYLNHDVLITLLILLANIFFFKYLTTRHTTEKAEQDTLSTVLFALCFGLSIATKITTLLTFPLYLALFFINKDYRNMVASIFIVFGVFILTNPFAWIFIDDFFSRLLEMRVKEAGMVFDSVNYSPSKYLYALSCILTLPGLLLSLYGSIEANIKEKLPLHRQFYALMFLQVLVYIIFFSLQARRVDRWMLPILPNLMLFTVYAISKIADSVEAKLSKQVIRISHLLLYRFSVLLILIGAICYYLYFSVVATSQFNRNTPKSASYVWAKESLAETSTKFVLTEEGLDPLNKLPLATVWQYNVYETKGAPFMYPPDPYLYDYIFISTRPLSWTQNPEVVKKYPYYSQKWKEFESTLNNGQDFMLIKSLEVTKPNLIPLSSVFIYKNTL